MQPGLPRGSTVSEQSVYPNWMVSNFSDTNPFQIGQNCKMS